MTLLKSSKHKKLFPSAYRNALRAGVLPFSLFFAGMALLFPVVSLGELLSKTEMISRSDYYDGEITHISQIYKYMLSPVGDELMQLVTAGTVLASVLMGISVFRFIVSKKTVNVYYSLGISRTSMFLARYTAGLTMLFVSIAVPLAASGIVSTAILGYDPQIIPNIIYMTFVIFTLAALTFSVTSCVFSAVGTTIEGTTFSAGVMALPTLVILCLQGFTESLLYGNPYVLDWYHNHDGDYVDLSMLDEFSLFNPLTYVYELLSNNALWIFEAESTEYVLSTGKTLKEQIEIDPVPALVWLGIAAVATVIAIRNYNKRKAEICGFFGKSTVLNYLASFAVGLAAFALILYNVYSVSLAITLGFAALAVCYLVVNLILTHSFRQVFKRIYLLGAQGLSVLVVVLVFMLGCFGYSSKIPQISEIKSASISPVTYENLLMGDQISNYYYYASDELSAYRASTDNSTMGPYTDTDDIERITRIHRTLLDLKGVKNDGYVSNVVIRYELYNGETFMRYYRLADMTTIKQILNLFESKYFDERIEESFFGDEYGYINEIYSFDTSRVVAIDSRIKQESFKQLDLSEEQFNALKRAVADDLKTMSAQQFYSPENPASGILVFTSESRLNFSKYEDFTGSFEITDDKLYEYVYASDSSSDDEAIIYITEYMTSTLKFLQENGLMECFPAADEDEIESIAFYPARLNRDDAYYSWGEATILEFRARNTMPDYHFYYDEEYNEEGYPISRSLRALYMQNLATDRKRIAEILPLTRLNYYAADKGYIAFITYKNGESVEKYITEDEAPEWVKTYEYVMNSYDLPEQAQTIK